MCNFDVRNCLTFCIQKIVLKVHKINSFGLDKVAEIKLSFNLFFVKRLYTVQCTYLNNDTFIFFDREIIWLLYRYSNSDCYILAMVTYLGGGGGGALCHAPPPF